MPPALARSLPNFSLPKALTNSGLFNMDSPGGSELFESYEQDFHAIKASINERITTSRSQHGGNLLSDRIDLHSSSYEQNLERPLFEQQIVRATKQAIL
ncbi:hypothetical protein KVV02_002483 [Mortierella alpina]|uniref:Uncharacterized protein n=1 Tax=Mortierella alpina TaxID=64518 RepID=A0A9P8A8E7_MORAP|nr:hypothetical protein KVV02_002483 [Mortierella alpina]